MSGGEAAGGAGGAGRGPAIPLASLAAVKGPTSLAAEGDSMLLGSRVFSPEVLATRAYCHNAHGSIITANRSVVSPYSHKAYSGTEMALVPPDCAFVTLAEEGHSIDSALEELASFYEVWGEKAAIPMFRDIYRNDKRGEEVRNIILDELLKPYEPKEHYKPIIILPGNPYPSNVVQPFCAWYDEPTLGVPQNFAYARSGILLCGTPNGQEIVNMPRCRPEDVNDAFLRWMYAGSVFPTPGELIDDEGLRIIRGEVDPNPDYPDQAIKELTRFSKMYDYITKKWSCTQNQLFIKLPGAHYNFVCRKPIKPGERSLFGVPPYGSRPLSLKGAEAYAGAMSATFGKGFRRPLGRNSRRKNRNRHRRQSKRRTRKHRK